MAEKIFIFDSTLRDGAQAEGISFSVEDKIRVVETLDKIGVDYIEAGNPGSNPKDIEFFNRIKGLPLKHAKLVAFGSTRRGGIAVEKMPTSRRSSRRRHRQWPFSVKAGLSTLPISSKRRWQKICG